MTGEEGLKQLLPNLWSFVDTCHVYVIRDGNEAVVIDFGSGDVLTPLRSLGITPRWVLHTCYHRQQCQGDHLLAKLGCKIAVPEWEAEYFTRADEFWQHRPLFNIMVTARMSGISVRNIEIAQTLNDYETFHWHNYSFRVIPTPGYTPGSISLVTEIDGRRVVFCGGLLSGSGTIPSLRGTQWTYGGPEGIVTTIRSLEEIEQEEPDLVLPSIGEHITDLPAEVRTLKDRLSELHRVRFGSECAANSPPTVIKVTDHLYCYLLEGVTTHVLLSESGKAFIIDYGVPNNAYLQPGHWCRPVAHTLGLMRKNGLKSADVIWPTHYHNDHIAGIGVLDRLEGAQVWCHELLKDLLEHPEQYDLPFLWSKPIKVSRTFSEGERFSWEEYSFETFQLQAHTFFETALLVEVDGKRVLSVGDAFLWEPEDASKRIWFGTVFHNRLSWGDLHKTLDRLRKASPDIILSGHLAPYEPRPNDWDRLSEWANQYEKLVKELTLPGTDMDGSCARLFPYYTQIEPGATVCIVLSLYNPSVRNTDASAVLRLPEGWQCDPSQLQVSLLPGWGNLTTRLTIPEDASASRYVITADVAIGGKKHGDVCEMLVEVAASNERVVGEAALKAKDRLS